MKSFPMNPCGADGSTMRRRIITLCATSLFLAGMLGFAGPKLRAQQSDQSSTTENIPAGNAGNGKKLFTNFGCYECHGTEGQGALQTGGARIGPPQLPVEAFVGYVRHPANRMPPYTSKVASNQDLADIYAYLKTIPMPPKGKDIPLLKQ